MVSSLEFWIVRGREDGVRVVGGSTSEHVVLEGDKSGVLLVEIS